MSILNKLLAIQLELKAPKSQYNSFGKYHYRNCEDILEAVKPIAGKYGAVLTLTDDIVVVGDRHYVKATAMLYDAESGESVGNTAFAREEAEKKGMDGSQVTGASSSYARKYALNGLFAIDDTKDSDATNNGEGSKPQAQAKPAPKTAPKTNEKGKVVETLTKSELVTVWGVKNAEETISWLERKFGAYYEDWTADEHSQARALLQAQKQKRENELQKMKEALQEDNEPLPFE